MGVDDSAAASGAENAELSQRRPEGAEKRSGKKYSLFYSLCEPSAFSAPAAVEGSSITK
jgi:hypothetical protein